jgi:uncharacterized protein
MSTTTYLEPVTESHIQETIRRIVDAVHPEQIILFGSQADGTARPESDMDILVKIADCEMPAENRYKAYMAINNALRGIRVAFDILIYTDSEFEARKNRYGIVNEAFTKGRSLYAKRT